MAKSWCTIEQYGQCKMHRSNFFHNSREGKKSTYHIDPRIDNFCDRNAKEAIEIYKREIEIRRNAYESRTNQKIQKIAKLHMSCCFHLPETDLKTQKEMLKQVTNYFETTFGTKVVQASIHNDEGFKDPETGEIKYNTHGQFEFIGLDTEGRSVGAKLNKMSLHKVQMTIAEITGSDFGTNTHKKHLNHYQYRQMKEAESQAIKEAREEEYAILYQLHEEAQELASVNARLTEANKQLKNDNKRLNSENIGLERDLRILGNNIEKLENKTKAKTLSDSHRIEDNKKVVQIHNSDTKMQNRVSTSPLWDIIKK